MVLTTKQIIQRAYRTQNLIPVAKEPTTAEQAEALGLYQGMVSSLLGNDIGQLLDAWEAPPSPASQNPGRFPLYPQQPNQDNQQQVWRNPPPNVQIITNAGIGDPLYFPPSPPNGARMGLANVGLDYATYPLTLSGNGRLIEGAADITISANPTTPIMWFYRGDLANWVRVSELTLDSNSPLPDNFDEFLRALLFSRIAGANGKDVSADTAQIIKHGHRLLKTTYLQTNPGATFPGAWRFNTYQGYGTPWRFGGGGFG